LSEDNNEEVPSSSSPKGMTKKDKRELAVQRAKASMQADKKKVEHTKAKKLQDKEPTEAPKTLFSEDELNRMTVIELKDLLRERGLKISGKKTEMVDRLNFYNMVYTKAA
jgi:hypothetical protein